MDQLREPLDVHTCGLPLALEVMGERWSFLLLRAAFNGLTHFEEFLGIGIARNILASRLAKLVEHGILVREPQADDRRKVSYRLTAKGVALLPAMLALRQWGERYGLGVPSNPVLVDRRDRRPIAPIAVHAQDGRVLDYADLLWVDGAELDPPAAGEAPDTGPTNTCC
ncbi:winged helix-turn-helix transcriptional regulator [Novosphingobium piscinae]|uniref:Helix-turn-helix transcriptional regulator n=1 Tax=Novosphingobium piscinae TaxID=1507448 RepID=A0A7X1KPU8_9SPHN|nr:helix-turn-helix domain-containing protein [Novosphingobium piscinae]MBC2669102.1 helix-turn-helix transcriptional regulator [Novosphingobium piscinae]